jgi:hypothetical protein
MSRHKGTPRGLPPKKDIKLPTGILGRTRKYLVRAGL